jgi:hypothetical protein
METNIQEKLKLWQGKLKKIEDDYQVIMQKRGEAMQMGDLRENAAYQMLSEDADTYRARIDEVKRIIVKIEEEAKKSK